MGKCLIVFTRKYPYSYGEPSLQDELPFHIPLYDRIIVLAQDVSRGEKTTRTPPEGIEYYNTATTSRRMGRVRDKVRCVRHALDCGEAVVSDADRVRRHPVRRVFLWSFEERCQRLIREVKDCLSTFDFSKYDEIVLYSYWFFANVRVAIGFADHIKAQGCQNVRVVSRAHRYDLYENRNRLNYLPMREYLLQNVESVYVCSQDGAEYLRKGHPGFLDKIKVGYVGTLDCGQLEMKRGAVFHIVTCCRIVPVKRLERLADALALVDAPCRWTIIGGGIEGDTYYNKVKAYITKTLSEKKNITVDYTGGLQHDDVFRYYQENNADVFINVSASEGLPAVIMEATSFGIPVIATDVGGTAEIVFDGKNGYLIPENFDNELLADRICKMMALTDEDYFRMRQNARQIWQEHFNAERNNAVFAEKVYGGISKEQ